MEKGQEVIIRKAIQADNKSIHNLIHLVHINPMDLNWERFLVAENQEGLLLGCGQIKVHRGGVLEMASIAVTPGARQRGIASQIIRRLIESTPEDLYLTCRARLETFYQPFGFEKITDPDLLPHYYSRILKLSRNLLKLGILNEPLLVMLRKNK